MPCTMPFPRTALKSIRSSFVRSTTLCVLLIASACAAGAQTLVVRSVFIINVENGRIDKNVDVLVEHGMVVRIGHRLKAAPETVVVEGHNRFLIPGLWDMHVHTTGLSASPEWSRRVLLLLIANGVTGVRDMGGDLEALQSWRNDIAAGKLLGPRIIAAGPMLDGEADGPSILTTRNPEEGRRAVDDLVGRKADFIKVLGNLDRSTYFAIAEESKQRNIAFSGHVPPVISTVEASNAGQKSIEHILYGGFALACSSQEQQLRPQMVAAMKSGAIRNVAKVEDAALATFSEEKSNVLWETLRRNQTWVVPTLVSTFVSAHMDKLAEEDANADYLPESFTKHWTRSQLQSALQPDKIEWYRRQLSAQIKTVHAMYGAGVRILAGTDAVDTHNVVGFSLPKELELLVEAGLTPLQALQSATMEPARYFGRRDLGSIAVGKVADLLLLSANPLDDIRHLKSIEAVVVAGRLLKREELDSMLSELRQPSATKVQPAP